MAETGFDTEQTIRDFFSVNDDMLKKVQEFYFGDNPVNAALAQINREDLQTFFDALAKNPARLMELQFRWWQGQMEIYRNVMMRALDKDNPPAPAITAEAGDRRFMSELWGEQPNFDLLSQSYLHFSKIVMDMLDSVEGLPQGVRDRLQFFTRQFINALSPGNFLWTNPEVLRQTMEENGANLVRGMEIFRDDLMNSGKYLKVRMTDSDSFQVGKDLAYTPGKVIFENEIFQFIQYEAATEEVFKTPLLFVPPFINKYYILDLRAQNSMVNWMREQGHTIFLISWRNPTPEQAHITYADLITDGVAKAAQIVEEVTGERDMNAIGYCIGGTVLAATQAWYMGKKAKNRIKSATYMTTILDFCEPGSLGVFINDTVISGIEAMNELRGVSDGRHLAVTFSLLRENTLYWNYYIENYLKGKEPSQFDILYWNSDGTNIPPKVHSFLLRNLYLDNELVQPNKVRIDGVGLNLGRVKTPNFFISTLEDHIALWTGTFKGAASLGGDSTLVLGESGHVAGIINPPAKNKYGYYTNPAPYTDGKSWLEGATFTPRSWWLAWQEWIAPYAGEKVAARAIGNEQYQAIEDAPGNYVKVNLI